jgi:hypothetical protein
MHSSRVRRRIGLHLVELSGQIFFEHRALLEFATGDLEDVDAPGDPGFCLGFVGVEQIGQRARLHRQGEIVHHLDPTTAQCFIEETTDQSLDPRDHGRFLGALEEGFDDGAVVTVVWRIRFDRQLSHRAHLLFRGDGHAEGGVGTEGLPVLGRPAHILVAQDHGDVLAVKRTLHHPRSFAGFTERIGVGGHGGKSRALGRTVNAARWDFVSGDFGRAKGSRGRI